MTVTLDLATFPQVTIDASWGRWWRSHSDQWGPWYFASSDTPGRDPAAVGRFDLPEPRGTCYVGEHPDGTVPESMRESGVSAADSQHAANARRLSAMPLDRWYGLPIADFTSAAVTRHGAPADIALIPREDARPWAIAASAAGFHGILYPLAEDPQRRRGLALFLDHGPQPPDGQPEPVRLVTGLRNEVLDLFGGVYRGDPLAI